MGRTTSKVALIAAFSLMFGLAACAEDSANSTSKTKNAALDDTLINGDFSPTGGG